MLSEILLGTKICNNSCWTHKPRPSSLLLTRNNHGTFKTLENQLMCKSGKPTQDGSSFSDSVVASSSTREVRLLDHKTRTTLSSEPTETESAPNGKSNGSTRCSHTKKESSIQPTVYIAKDNSILFLPMVTTNTLTF